MNIKTWTINMTAKTLETDTDPDIIKKRFLDYADQFPLRDIRVLVEESKESCCNDQKDT